MSSHDATSGRRSTTYAPKVTAKRQVEERGDFAGWISEAWGIAWVVSKHRKDKRTGVVSIRLATAAPSASIVRLPARKPAEEVTDVYVLQYTARGGEKNNRGQFKRIAAVSDQEAAVAARVFLSGAKIPELWKQEAALFQDEREVPIWTPAASVPKKGAVLDG